MQGKERPQHRYLVRLGCFSLACHVSHAPRFETFFMIVSWGLLCSAVLIAVLTGDPRRPVKSGSMPSTGGARELDWVIRGFGNGLPIGLWALRAAASHGMPGGYKPERPHTPWMWLARWGSLGVLLAFSALRIGLYSFIAPYHYYFSDHIFLIASIVAMADIEDAERARCSAVLPPWCLVLHRTLGALLVLAAVSEAFRTAFYFHTAQASFLALLAGVAVFGGLSRDWIEAVVLPAGDGCDEPDDDGCDFPVGNGSCE